MANGLNTTPQQFESENFLNTKTFSKAVEITLVVTILEVIIQGEIVLVVGITLAVIQQPAMLIV